ncbi:MAG TPA: hypothetical protein VME22_23295 [Solirubrobacteraceae bacterium]|nr:hypothetical protein [Solirubrobacteraceae bacterium]
MASTDQADAAAPEPEPEPDRGPDGEISAGRVRRMFAGSREAIRIAYRDPEHLSERLALYAIARLAEPTEQWAESMRSTRADTSPAEIVEELRLQTAQVARIDGAISGTPFLIALVPGYLSYLYQEMRMTLRAAALYGRDPRHLQTAGEMLALRGVHPDVEQAQAALRAVQDTPIPERPPRRRSLRFWVDSGYRLLVFGGFLSAAAAEPPKRRALDRIRAILSFLVGAGIWVMTWVLPFTFMIMMAWGCESHARQLGRRALVFYDGEAASVEAAMALAARRRDRGHDKRAALRAVALFLSVAIPIGFVALVNHLRNTVGFNWLVAVGALVAVSLVVAMAVISSRR